MRLFMAAFLSVSLLAGDGPQAPEPDQLWTGLLEGNRRFVSNQAVHPHQDAATRAALAASQKPNVVVLACADSRVAPEVVFDQGLGVLFVVRVAGNIPDDHILGSIEYAVEHLGSRLIVVLGHERCGAVSAAVKGGHVEGHVASLLEALAPAVASTKEMRGDQVENAMRANVIRSADQIRTAPPLLRRWVAEGKIKVLGARYDLGSGTVERIE